MAEVTLNRRLEPLVEGLAVGIGLTFIQIAALYILNAIGFFEGNPVYNIFSYPFAGIYNVIGGVVNIVFGPDGGIQILHPERVFMRIFFVSFLVYLFYFSLSNLVGLERDGGLKFYKKEIEVKPELLLEVLGLAVILCLLLIGAIYFTHTVRLFPAFQGAYNSIFFLFDYIHAIIKFTVTTLIGQNDRIMVLNTDIFKRIFFVITSVNLIWFGLSGLTKGEK